MKLCIHGVKHTHLSLGAHAKNRASMTVQVWCAQHSSSEYDSDSSADKVENPDLHDEINKPIRPIRSGQ